MMKQFEFFKVSLFISVRKMILSKAFSMSEMDIYQILKLNYCKKLQECWTNDVDGDCISFNLYINTENSKILLKRWRVDYKNKLPDLSTMFLFKRVNSD